MIQIIRKIAERWELENILLGLGNLQNQTKITVGILGDFSSGKSTLINEFVGIDHLLPAKVEPCTSVAVEVIADKKVKEPQFFSKDEDGTLERIQRSKFNDLTNGKGEGRPVVHLPPAKGFPSGFVLIDTPGLQSLTEGHTDITMAALPFLDAAIICVDIQKGGISREIKNFLKAPGVHHLRKRFILALTHADKQSESAKKKIRQKTIKASVRIFDWTIDEAEKKVLIVSAGPDAKKRDIQMLQDAMEELFVSRRKILQKERTTRVALQIIPEAIRSLEQYKEALQESNSELQDRKRMLQKDIEKQRQERNKHQQDLQRFQQSLRREVQATCSQHKQRLVYAHNETDLHEASEDFSNALTSAVMNNVGRFTNKFVTNTSVQNSELFEDFTRINNTADISKTIGTMALTALIAPGAGLIGNSAEAGIGAMIRNAGKTAAKSSLKTFVGKLFSSFDRINPIGFVTDFIAGKVKEQSIDIHLDDFAAIVSRDAMEQLESLYEEEYFSRIEQEQETLRKNLRSVEQERRADQSRRTRRTSELSSDISRLRSLQK